MNPISKRFLQLLDHLIDKNVVKNGHVFAKSVGMKPASITEIRKGRSGIGTKYFGAISEKYGVNTNWLLTGTGMMFNRPLQPLGQNFIAVNIKFLRERARLSQEEFGAKIQASRSQVGSYEEGRAKPKTVVTQNICREFGISNHDLLYTQLTEKNVGHEAYAADSEINHLMEKIKFLERENALLRQIAGVDRDGNATKSSTILHRHSQGIKKQLSAKR